MITFEFSTLCSKIFLASLNVLLQSIENHIMKNNQLSKICSVLQHLLSEILHPQLLRTSTYTTASASECLKARHLCLCKSKGIYYYLITKTTFFCTSPPQRTPYFSTTTTTAPPGLFSSVLHRPLSTWSHLKLLADTLTISKISGSRADANGTK